MINIIKRFCSLHQKFNLYAEHECAPLHVLNDGTFDDVDYTCESRSAWSLSNHMRYTTALATLYDRTGEEKYASLANLSLAHWAKNDYRNSNWWHNDIGIPRLLMHAALFLGERIEKNNLEYVLSRLPDDVEERWTGANKIWLAENVLCKGLLLGDADVTKIGCDIIKSTIFVSERGVEGIQQDGSFTQHGVQLYNHGYGLSYISNVSTWGYILQGSDFAFTDELVDIITDFVLNGTYRMFRNGAMDFHPRSREIVRGIIGQPGHMDMHLPSLKILLELNTDPLKKSKLLQVYNHILHGERMPLLESNNMYYCVDYMTHVKKHYYASVRWASKNVLGGDMQGGTPVNSENLLAGFASYGGTCYMVSGKEYENIMPVWDWGMLPGTTTPHVELPVEIGGVHESTFVGGVTTGKCGLIASDLHKSYQCGEQATFSGKMSSFMFEDVIVHLGCALNSTSELAFNTTFNQCLLNGDVYADGKAVKGKYFTDISAKSVFHDNIAYYNLDSSTINMELGPKTGDWHRVYGADNVPDTPVTKDVFLLYKPLPKENAGYAYAVVPGISVDTYKTLQIQSHVEILSNSCVQAVYGKTEHLLGAVFYNAGKCECNGVKIVADSACVLMFDFGTNVAYISVPDPKDNTLQISVGDKKQTIEVPMDYETVGKTIKVQF